MRPRRIAFNIGLLVTTLLGALLLARVPVVGRVVLPVLSLLLTGTLVVRILGPLLWENRRRNAQVAATHPGWGMVAVLTTSSQIEAMGATEKYVVAQVNSTLAYGPTGIELWARHRDGSVIRVIEHPWSQIVEVRAVDDVLNFRGWRVRGLRITLVDGHDEDLIVTVPADLIIGSSRATKIPQLTALANDILARRTAPATPHA